MNIKQLLVLLLVFIMAVILNALISPQSKLAFAFVKAARK